VYRAGHSLPTSWSVGVRSGVFRTLSRRLDRLSERNFALASFTPGALLIALIVLPPILAALTMSLFRIELLHDNNTPFVGLHNFVRSAADEDFRSSLPLTVGFAVATTLVSLPIALATALVLRRNFRGASVLGVAILLPWAVAPVVTGGYWRFIFNGNFGLVTGIAMVLGLTKEPIPWLANTQLAVAVAVVATVWRSVPLLSILLLAAVKSIPQSLYRAAAMDGATGWNAFRWITLPSIQPTLVVVAILQIISSLQVFDVLYTLTGGGPGRATTVLSLYIYQKAIQDLSFGYSAALAVILALMVALSASALFVSRLRNRRVDALADEYGTSTFPLLSETAPLPVARQRRRRTQWTSRFRRPTRQFFFSLVVALVLLWLLGPVLWIAIASVQPEYAVTTAPPHLTLDVSLSTYIRLLTNHDWQSSTLVSLQVAIFTAIVAIFVGAVAAYPLARYQITGRRIIVGALITTQLMPAIVLVIPVLYMAQIAHLKDTVAVLVLVNVAFTVPLVTWLLMGFFRNIPVTLEHAARIDGCSRLGTLFRVTMPAALPGIAATAILLLIGTWNEFLFAVVLGDRNAVTVTRQIALLQTFTGGPEGAIPYTVLAAAGILAVLPCFVLVVFFHKRVMTGLTEGFGKL
jgi:multiple sugar transport system permease protein